ncbi:MAG: D-2-hydroxyacid dehydrogenase [Acidobacteriota bacterium]|nr:D-2-hydroxyacid dehydrogenase [Acidobacteriota bacterium]
MERIVFLDRDTLIADLRRPSFAHEWREYGATAPGEVVERLRDATIAITNKVPLREGDLRQLPQLKFIAVAATGMDNIDLDYCRAHGVAVSNVRDYSVHSLPEHVLMMMLALRRNLINYREDLRRGAWQKSSHFCILDYPIHDLNGCTLGIIGYGTLGRAVEKLARAFGMKILIAERKGATKTRDGRTPFTEVLRASDVVTLHTSLDAETRNLIGAEELAVMKRGALLINCARGGVVDEAALAEALRGRRIAGAGVDVLSREPPRNSDDGGDNPLLDPDLPNLILTPHVAWASREAMQTLADQLISNIEKAVMGDR